MAAAGIAASIGSAGDAYDNSFMESAIGLLKTEVIKPGRTWRTHSQVELATAEWVDWYCHRRLHGEIGHNPTRRIRDQLLPHDHETTGRNHNLQFLPNSEPFNKALHVRTRNLCQTQI
ncbi:integrase core domain-containing protein [Streptomyces sp. NPDC005574]|uniref:integrase core domain-containing protein n=1 Tax=Streptomyces sp. NPDC005574 TaxID=3156891 RepID=UPI0033BE8202